MTTALLWLLGVLLARALCGARRPGAAALLGLGALLGPAAASLLLVLLLQLDAPQALPGALLGLGVVAALAGWWRRPSGSSREARALAAVDAVAPRDSTRDGSRAWLLLPALALASALVITSDHRRAVPDGTFDALVIWNHHARLLTRVDHAPTELLHALRTTHHADYPLLLPGAVAAQWRLRGDEAPQTARDTALLFVLALALLAWSAARRGLPRAPAALLTTLTLLVPLVADKAQGQKADVLLAALFLAAADACASRAHRDPRRRASPALAGVLVALLPWAKNEGLVWAAALVTALLVVRPAREAARGEPPTPPAPWWRPALLGALPVAAVVVLHARLWAPADPLVSGLGERLGAQLGDPERWRTVLGALLARLDPRAAFRDWGAAPTALLGALLLGLAARRGRPPRAAALLGLALLLQLAAITGIYLLTNYPKGPEAHLRTSLDRLLLQLWPVALLTAGLLLRAPPAETDPRAPPAPPRR